MVEQLQIYLKNEDLLTKQAAFTKVSLLASLRFFMVKAKTTCAGAEPLRTDSAQLWTQVGIWPLCA